MRVAGAIDEIGRGSTEAVTAAIGAYADRRAGLARTVRRSSAAEYATRDRLQREADLADVENPRILLPADLASGSPHTRRR